MSDNKAFEEWRHEKAVSEGFSCGCSWCVANAKKAFEAGQRQMNERSKAELLPCLSCGRNHLSIEPPLSFNTDYFVRRCLDCGLMLFSDQGQDVVGSRWNIRHLPPSVEAVLEAAREIIAQRKIYYSPNTTQDHEIHMYDSLEGLDAALNDHDKGRK